MIIRLDGTVQMAQKITEAYSIEIPATINEDGTVNMNATQTKLNEIETYYIDLFGDGE
jgi:hypothetical protein